ncbi:MAG TPA: hypothetical protein VGI03_03210 [Verrucomicrobiae bacterium]|jgi:hypothetical protein
MDSDAEKQPEPDRKTAPFFGAGRTDFVRAALDHLRRIPTASGESSGPPTSARQKESLCEWARRLGLLLDADAIVPRLRRGGQEHDIFQEGERVFKVTRNGIFGLSPGIELALVSSAEDARRFQLWEATPLEYLERLDLHNQLVSGLNIFEGIFVQPDGDMAIVTSQPRFDIVPVTEAEIDAWFALQGFKKITHSAYYRDEDNLGVFDAHDKNVVRAGPFLVPFDVIPCRPAGGFLKFIADTIASGHTLKAERTVSTTTRPPS